jgi:hypothetical protein
MDSFHGADELKTKLRHFETFMNSEASKAQGLFKSTCLSKVSVNTRAEVINRIQKRIEPRLKRT